MARVKGGSLAFHSGSGTTINQNQGQDAKDKTTLATTSERNQEIVIPAGSRIILDAPVGSSNLPASIVLSSNAVFKTSSKDTVQSGIGAAQKNVLGEVVAKLESLQWITYVGAALVLFGLASLFYPPLKLIVNSVTTSLAIVGAGAAFIVLPSLIVGHELLILGGVAAAVGLYWFAHRHGSISGQLKSILNGTVTANTNSPTPAPPAASNTSATSPNISASANPAASGTGPVS